MPGDVARMFAAQKRAGSTKFIRRAEASRGNGFGANFRQFFVGFAVALRPVGDHRLQALSVERAGEEAVDGDVAARNLRLPREACDEAR